MARSFHKTSEMRRFEEDRGETIESLIRRMHDDGKTQAEMAEALGVSRPTFYLWMARLGTHYTIHFTSEETEQLVR